jgi:hypothetical protein
MREIEAEECEGIADDVDYRLARKIRKGLIDKGWIPPEFEDRQLEFVMDNCRTNMVPCGNKHCQFWDKIDPYGCTGECSEETAIASCKTYVPVIH